MFTETPGPSTIRQLQQVPRSMGGSTLCFEGDLWRLGDLLELGDLVVSLGEPHCHSSSPSNLNRLVMPLVQGVCPKSSLLQALLAWPSVWGHSSLCSLLYSDIGLEMPFYLVCSQNTVIWYLM